MALSRRPKQEAGQLAIYQLLLEIAQSLNSLASDPEALQRSANNAYKLEDEAAQKAKSAYGDIEKANLAKQDAEKKMLVADDMVQKAEKAKLEAAKLLDLATIERKRMSNVDAELGARALKLHDKEVDIKDREAKLIVAQDKLDKQLKSIEAKQAELHDLDISLKIKAEKLRSIVDE